MGDRTAKIDDILRRLARGHCSPARVADTGCDLCEPRLAALRELRALLTEEEPTIAALSAIRSAVGLPSSGAGPGEIYDAVRRVVNEHEAMRSALARVCDEAERAAGVLRRVEAEDPADVLAEARAKIEAGGGRIDGAALEEAVRRG